MTELVQHRLAASNVALGGGAFTGAYKTKKKKRGKKSMICHSQDARTSVRRNKHSTRTAYATITRWKRETITKGPGGRLSTSFGTQAVRRDPALPPRLRGRRKRSNVPTRGGGRYGASRVDPGVGAS